MEAWDSIQTSVNQSKVRQAEISHNSFKGHMRFQARLVVLCRHLEVKVVHCRVTVCVCVWLVSLFLCVYVSTFACVVLCEVDVWMCAWVCVCMCVYVCGSACMCREREREGEGEREKDGHRGRKTDTEREGERETEGYREKKNWDWVVVKRWKSQWSCQVTHVREMIINTNTTSLINYTAQSFHIYISTFRVFCRRFQSERPTISSFVRRKRNNNISLSVKFDLITTAYVGTGSLLEPSFCAQPKKEVAVFLAGPSAWKHCASRGTTK